MSLDNIAGRIREDAAAEAASLASAAESERRSALDGARRRLEEEFTRALEKLSRDSSDLEARLRFHAGREAGRMVENARRTLLDRSISLAVERLAGLPDDEYRSLISSILAGCRMQGDIEVRISPADENRITPDLLERASCPGRSFHLSPLRHNGTGGVVMTSGGVSLNATFSMLASLERERMVMELSPLLSRDDG